MFVFPAPYTVAAATLTGAYVTSGAEGASLSIGAAPTGGERRFVVAVATGYGVITSTNPTIGGNSTTTIVTSSDSSAADSITVIYYAEISSGTSAVFDSNFNTTPTGARIHVYRLITTASAGISVTDFASDNSDGTVHTLSLDVADNGFVVAGAVNQNGLSHTWIGLTENGDTDIDASDFSTGASDTFVSAATPTEITVTRATSTSNSTSASASFEVSP